MNYKTVSNSNFKLTARTIDKSIPHNKASKKLAKILYYSSKLWKFISNLIFDSVEYYDKNNINSSSNHCNYDITDVTELRLIASRRTFL